MDSASLENHPYNGRNSRSHNWPLLGRCMSKFHQMANTRDHFMLYIRLLFIHMLLNAYKRDWFGLLYQTISMYPMCDMCICLYIRCVRHGKLCWNVKIILAMATGGMVVFQFNKLIWNFVRRYVRGVCMCRCSSVIFRCSVWNLWLSTISKTRKMWCQIEIMN